MVRQLRQRAALVRVLALTRSWYVARYLVAVWVLTFIGVASKAERVDVTIVVGSLPIGLVLGFLALSVSVQPAGRGLEEIGRVEGALTSLRLPRRADAAELHRTIDDDVVRINGWPGPGSARQWRASASYVPQLNWVVIARGDDRIVGALSIDRPLGPEVELGWWIGPEARGRGYATDAVAVATHALHETGVRRIRVGTAEDNVPVRRILEGTGFALVEQRPHQLPNGTVAPSYWYEHTVEPEIPI